MHEELQASKTIFNLKFMDKIKVHFLLKLKVTSIHTCISHLWKFLQKIASEGTHYTIAD